MSPLVFALTTLLKTIPEIRSCIAEVFGLKSKLYLKSLFTGSYCKDSCTFVLNPWFFASCIKLSIKDFLSFTTICSSFSSAPSCFNKLNLSISENLSNTCRYLLYNFLILSVVCPSLNMFAKNNLRIWVPHVVLSFSSKEGLICSFVNIANTSGAVSYLSKEYLDLSVPNISNANFFCSEVAFLDAETKYEYISPFLTMSIINSLRTGFLRTNEGNKGVTANLWATAVLCSLFAKCPACCSFNTGMFFASCKFSCIFCSSISVRGCPSISFLNKRSSALYHADKSLPCQEPDCSRTCLYPSIVMYPPPSPTLMVWLHCFRICSFLAFVCSGVHLFNSAIDWKAFFNFSNSIGLISTSSSFSILVLNFVTL